MPLDLERLPFEEGGYLLVKQALRALQAGDKLTITGSAPDLEPHLRAWCRQEGHTLLEARRHPHGIALVVEAGAAPAQRWAGALRAGHANPRRRGAVVEHPPASWGLAARGALVEAGAPQLDFPLADRIEVWTLDSARLYAQAVANQWDPNRAIPWSEPFNLPAEVEDAVVQVMTYLVENETAALLVPSRFLTQIHPHFRETLQLLAVQAGDEARHMEVFARRATLKRDHPGLSSAGGQASLKTLLEEADFASASFLLSVLGEGSFLALLGFLARHAPDPVTEAACRLAAQDEGRHVGFALSHLHERIALQPALREQLAAAVRRRHHALRDTAGLNGEVFDALVVLAAGAWQPAALAAGYRRVIGLVTAMDEGRRKRLLALGFAAQDAADLSSLHTRNFM